MKKVFITLLLAATCFLPTLQAFDWSDVVKKVEPSVVWAYQVKEHACTAFVINQEKHYLLTAAHCYAGDQGILWVDSVVGLPILVDGQNDLMVVEAKYIDPKRPALHPAAKDPERGQEVMSIGYGYALSRPLFRRAGIQDDKANIGTGAGPYVSTDAPYVSGQSGGPVVNDKVELVSIVQMGDAATSGFGVGVEKIKEVVGRFFEVKK